MIGKGRPGVKGKGGSVYKNSHSGLYGDSRVSGRFQDYTLTGIQLHLSAFTKDIIASCYHNFFLAIMEQIFNQYPSEGPGGGGGLIKSRMCPPYPRRVVKGD